MNGNAPSSMAEFKRIATGYTCELVHSYCGPVPVGHKMYGLKRPIVKVQSNAFQYEGGSWLHFPSAKETTFEDMGPGSFMLETSSDNGENVIKQIYRKIA